MSKNYKYFFNPLVMSFGITFRGAGGLNLEAKKLNLLQEVWGQKKIKK
jgi:hypothetical protein